MICEGVIACLLADAPLSGWAGLAVVADTLPQGTLPPAVVVTEGEGGNDEPLNRAAGTLEWVDVQLDCQAASRQDAGRLRVAVRGAVTAAAHGLRGRAFGPFTVSRYTDAGRSSAYDPPAHGEATGTYTATQRYRVWLTRPAGL